MDFSDSWTPDDGAARARARFAAAYDAEPTLVASAPGRVNLIGEHTDYNDGLCLPIALPHATYAAAAARDDGVFRLVSGHDPDDVWEGRVGDLASASGWAAYAAGVIWALGEQGMVLDGIDLAVDSCVPIGAGLSSSASLECSTGLAVLGLLGADVDDPTRRLLAQAGIRAENEVAGASTGGMDQTVAVGGAEGRALLLDCRSWETRLVPFAPEGAGLALVVVDTRVHHALNDGGYASRRTDCETAASDLGLPSLREATESDLERLTDERVQRRARHIVTEIARVERAVAALEAGDWAELGRLMDASHVSMRDDFEISCPELDAVCEAAARVGATGARMTGGGFGGSAIVLLERDAIDPLRAAVGGAFTAAGWDAPAYLRGTAGPAARIL